MREVMQQQHEIKGKAVEVKAAEPKEARTSTTPPTSGATAAAPPPPTAASPTAVVPLPPSIMGTSIGTARGPPVMPPASSRTNPSVDMTNGIVPASSIAVSAGGASVSSNGVNGLFSGYDVYTGAGGHPAVSYSAPGGVYPCIGGVAFMGAPDMGSFSNLPPYYGGGATPYYGSYGAALALILSRLVQ